MDKLTALCKAMITYDKGDPRRIHHFLKVHAFAAQIGREEGLDEKTLFRLEAAAYVHDIGIHEGERRFGRNDGQIQQELGPDEARPILEALGFDKEDTERICWLVAHHHSYGSIDGPDAQILAEADMLVNQYEDGAPLKQNEALYHRLYKTEAGKRMFRELYFETYEGIKKVRDTSLVYPVRADGSILLGRKRRGMGYGKWNGFGGKIEAGETMRQCACRELLEECGLVMEPEKLVMVGDLYFHQPSDPQWSHAGIVYFARGWKGTPHLSDEMEPRWFRVEDFPYDDMWMADRVWLPMILSGKKIRGTIYFAEDGETVYDYDFREMT